MVHSASDENPIYGVLGEFTTSDALLIAAQEARKNGFTRMEAYSPFPIHGLAENLGMRGTHLPLLVLLGGILGLIGGFFLQYYASVIDYPYNVGGRPFNSWPAFIPVCFELTVLCAAFAAVFGMLGLNGLPQPYHPVFNIDRFSQASRDRFFLCIETQDKKFDLDQVKQFFQRVKAEAVFEVEA